LEPLLLFLFLLPAQPLYPFLPQRQHTMLRRGRHVVIQHRHRVDSMTMQPGRVVVLALE
jgi:hypothetical protein